MTGFDAAANASAAPVRRTKSQSAEGLKDREVRRYRVKTLHSVTWREWAGRASGEDSYQRFDVVRGLAQMLRRKKANRDQRRCGTAIRRCFSTGAVAGKAEGKPKSPSTRSRSSALTSTGAESYDGSNFSFMGSTSIFAQSADPEFGSPGSSPSVGRPRARSAQSWSPTTGSGASSDRAAKAPAGPAAPRISSQSEEASQLRNDIARVESEVASGGASPGCADRCMDTVDASPDFGRQFDYLRAHSSGCHSFG